MIGYNNPTLQCGYSGRLHFASCHNVTIEGIIWNEWGANANVNATQGIKLHLYNSSNIIFQNCIFQNSLHQSIVLLEVTGNANINFTYNNHCKNHGAAIHYSLKLNHAWCSACIYNKQLHIWLQWGSQHSVFLSTWQHLTEIFISREFQCYKEFLCGF